LQRGDQRFANVTIAARRPIEPIYICKLLAGIDGVAGDE